MGKSAQKNSITILIANGVNLDLLGTREPEIYGKDTLQSIEKYLTTNLPNICKFSSIPFHVQLQFFQSNSEEKFLEKLSGPFQGIILNSGAWTHTSLAIADRLRAVQTPFVEIHLSNLAQREDFRQKSFTASSAIGVIYGFGTEGYRLALLGLLQHLAKHPPKFRQIVDTN